MLAEITELPIQVVEIPDRSPGAEPRLAIAEPRASRSCRESRGREDAVGFPARDHKVAQITANVTVLPRRLEVPLARPRGISARRWPVNHAQPSPDGVISVPRTSG